MYEMTRKEKILFILILFFLSTLFLPWILLINVIAASLLGLFAFVFNSWKEKWLTFKERKHIRSMFLFFIMIIISVLLSSNFWKRASLFGSTVTTFIFSGTRKSYYKTITVLLVK
jgi:hypothetical protein